MKQRIVRTPGTALSLNEGLIALRKHVKEQDKEIRRLKEENEFLEEARKSDDLMKQNFQANWMTG